MTAPLEAKKVIRGIPPGKRLVISIDMTTNYLFSYPEISNFVAF